MELNKKAAYLQGLVDGLGIDDTTKEGKIIKAMSALLGEMAEVIESVDEDLSRAYDQINDLSDELEDLEADLYEEEDEDGESEDAEDEDSDGDDDAKDDDIASEPFYEVACPNCGETVYVSEDDLDAGEANCAHCGEEPMQACVASSGFQRCGSRTMPVSLQTRRARGPSFRSRRCAQTRMWPAVHQGMKKGHHACMMT